jgi:hypothetical protein
MMERRFSRLENFAAGGAGEYFVTAEVIMFL